MTVEDIDIRLKKDEWNYLIEKYPHVAFNYRNFNGTPNNKQNGFRIIYTAEPPIMMPQQWKVPLLKGYDWTITYNSKFYNNHKDELNMKLVKGCLACNAYYQLDSFVPYEQRIDAACILNKVYHTNNPGDIVWVREEIARKLQYPVHVWCFNKWGGSKYKGAVKSPTHHSHLNHLKKINEYKFCICPESSYHEYNSWDFMTERMFNCFKAKTVPAYIGCYNIEQHVPKDLFIDLRDFATFKRDASGADIPKIDYPKFSQYLKDFPRSKWEDMTEKAFEWNKTNRIGNIEDLEKVIAECS